MSPALPLLFAAQLPAAPPAEGGAAFPPDLAADLVALTDGIGRLGADADAQAFRRLVERADDWRTVRTQDRSVPAARALRAVVQAGGPFADRADDALQARRAAIWAELERGGVRIERPTSTGGTHFNVDVLRRPGVTRRIILDRPAPPGRPHPAVRLRLLDWGGGAPGAWPINLYFKLDQRRARLTDAHFEDLCGTPALASLELSGLDGLPAAWRETLRAHPTLGGLSADECGITAEDCAAFATIPNLQRISLYRNPIGDAGLKALGTRPTLRSLNLQVTGITDDGLRGLAGLTAIDTFHFTENEGVSDAGFTALPLRNIQRLNLSGTRCGDGALKYMIGRWADPEQSGSETTAAGLPISGPPGVPENGISVVLARCAATDAGLAHLAAAPRISGLFHHAVAVTGTGFDAWAEAGKPLPREVSVHGGAFDDAGCLAMSRCAAPHEMEVRLNQTRATAAGVDHLRALPNLTTLRLAGRRVADDRSLAAAATFPALKRLFVREGPATGAGFAVPGGRAPAEVDFMYCPVTDAGVRAVASLPGLEELIVENPSDEPRAEPTDAVWGALVKVPGLRRVEFRNFPVAGPGLADLADHRGPRADPTGTEGEQWVTRLEAAVRFGWVGEEVGRPSGWAADLWRQDRYGLPTDLIADPLPAIVRRLALAPRRVPRPPGPVLKVDLDGTGLTADLLRSLPRMPVGTWILTGDGLTKAATAEFRRRQTDVERMYVSE